MIDRRSYLGGLAAFAVTAPRLVRAASQSVTVFAAASLADVLQSLATSLSASEMSLRFSFAASSTLARQIEQGAPADLYISADAAWMDYLIARGRIEADSRRVLATNRMVVVRPGNSSPPGEPSESVAALRDALLSGDASGRIATGDPAHVPIGRYAEAALRKLGLWHEVSARLVRADSVRSALAFVERAEVVAGIVYATDARVAQRLHVAARFPQDSHAPITYPMALVRGASVAARPVWARLLAPPAQAALREAGFGSGETAR